MCVVIDLDVVCLICLQPNKDMTPIFSADKDDPELEVAQKISILSELKTNQSNRTLPTKICTNCLQDMTAAWRFRKNCQAAVTIFQTIVKLDAKPTLLAAKELDQEQIKVPHGLQIKKVSIGNESEDEKKTTNLEQESKADGYISNNDKLSSTLYEELETNSCSASQDKDVNEFQMTEESNEIQEQREFADDDNSFLEYYITEDGVIEDETNDDNKTLSKETVVRIINKQTSEDEEQPSNTFQVTKRGRPKKQNLLEKETTKVVRTRTNVLETPNSSEYISKFEVREVKTRKRKTHSPETKTPKICEICGNSYRYQHALNAHMRRHFNDKPYPCECCDKAFVANVELRRHMRVHTGQKPYACQYCERRFSDFGSRIKHERTHTGERPYHCITCGKSFAYPHVLSVHLRTHTGEKRFRCEYCSKGFTKKAYLLTHVSQHHSNFLPEIDETVENNLKSPNLEECVYTAEMSNEIIDEEEYEEECFEEPENIVTDSLIDTKIEAGEESEMHEIVETEHADFTITVR